MKKEIIIEFKKEEAIQVELKDNEIEFDMSNVISLYDGEEYKGNYEVTPQVTSQILKTKNKVMMQDMTIKEIPYYEVGNLANGNTVYIGKEL